MDGQSLTRQYRRMPRGNPKRVTAVRLDPALVEDVKRYTDDFTVAVEEALALWLKPARRQRAKPDPLARHFAPPTPRERAIPGLG
jgi:hypothetical protein